jgi:hypothetical protein
MWTRVAVFVSATLLTFGCNAQKTSVRPEAGTAPIAPADPAPAPPVAGSAALRPSETTAAPARGEVKREPPGAPAASVLPAVPRRKAQNEQDCKACGGVWAPHGISTKPSCNCATSDGGKRCKDGAECEGVCVAAGEPEREVVDPGPPPRGFFVGRCSKTVAIFGCYRPIERGASATHADLTTPPQTICAD